MENESGAEVGENLRIGGGAVSGAPQVLPYVSGITDGEPNSDRRRVSPNGTAQKCAYVSRIADGEMAGILRDVSDSTVQESACVHGISIAGEPPRSASTWVAIASVSCMAFGTTDPDNGPMSRKQGAVMLTGAGGRGEDPMKDFHRDLGCTATATASCAKAATFRRSGNAVACGLNNGEGAGAAPGRVRGSEIGRGGGGRLGGATEAAAAGGRAAERCAGAKAVKTGTSGDTGSCGRLSESTKLLCSSLRSAGTGVATGGVATGGERLDSAQARSIVRADGARAAGSTDPEKHARVLGGSCCCLGPGKGRPAGAFLDASVLSTGPTGAITAAGGDGAGRVLAPAAACRHGEGSRGAPPELVAVSFTGSCSGNVLT